MKSTYSILYEHLQYIIYLAEDELKAISLEVQIYLNNNDQNIISYNQTLDESGGKKEHVKSQLYLGINLLSTITKAMYHYSLVLSSFWNVSIFSKFLH